MFIQTLKIKHHIGTFSLLITNTVRIIHIKYILLQNYHYTGPANVAKIKTT